MRGVVVHPFSLENKKERKKERKAKVTNMIHEFKFINVQLPYELPCKFHAKPPDHHTMPIYTNFFDIKI
jgi:hypothetical protein